MTEIGTLIDRLEKAAGADREIDLALFKLLEPEWFQQATKWRWPSKAVHIRCTPEFTNSIDVALMLLPSTQNWSLETEPCGHYFKTWTLEPQQIFGGQNWAAKDFVASAAMAICIAVLRSREATQ